MKINPFSNTNPMTWKDAAKVSLILSTAAFFTVFLFPYTYIDIKQQVGQFIFEALRFYGSAFFTNFIALAGLAQLTKEKEK